MVQTLADKVATYDPSIPEWHIADLLNTPDATLGTKNVDVLVSDVRALLMINGFWGGIRLTASDTTKATNVRALCTTVQDSLLNLTILKMSDPTFYAAIKSMADNLLALGLTDQATHDTLMNLCVRNNSWADVNNGGVPLTSRDVGLARGAKA